MPRMSNSAIEKTTEDSLATKIEPFMSQVSVSTKPMVVCGVQRKANIGNYETLDVYCALALPVDLAEGIEKSEMYAEVAKVIEECFKITSHETYERYKLIKDSLKG